MNWMKSLRFLILICSKLAISHLLVAQTSQEGYEHLLTPVQSYVVYQTKLPVLLDGKADEADWQQADWTADFEDIEGDKKPKPLFRTRLKMLWDESNLYLFAELEEPHIWAYYDTPDQIVYHENDIEVFIDPDGNTHDYYEYEVNARNTLFDLMMPKPYRNGGHANITWHSKGFRSVVSVDGTLNNPRDTDKKWSVEMKIPFTDLGEKAPLDAQIWKMNFSRVQWRTEVIDGKYQKIKEPSTGRALPESNWVWSPPGLINMHYPERWGMVQFSTTKPGSESVEFNMPDHESIAKHLWLVYYKQQDFKEKNNRYAASLEELGLSQKCREADGLKFDLKATRLQFTVQVEAKDGSVLSINETGLFLNNQP